MMIEPHYPVSGAGLGLRRELLEPLKQHTQLTSPVDFLEVAPENWLQMGGRLGRQFAALTERFPFVTHGLSLSIGSPSPLDKDLILAIKRFLNQYQIRCYSEHLSYCSDSGQLYDLLPIPFTEAAVSYVAQRIRQVQDMLERKIALENVSYYAALDKEMEEIEFLNAVLEEADCDLLLDINNLYVNSVNHGYDALEYLRALPGERIAYAHIAGHYREAEDLIIDTHGAAIIDPVWELLDSAYDNFGVFPTLVERDFNIPAYEVLIQEVKTVAEHQKHSLDNAQEDVSRDQARA